MEDLISLIICIVMLIICAVIFRAIWESDLPMWLKVFLLK